MVLTGTSGQVWDVRFSPDGAWLATASHDGTGVRVFDAGTGAPLFSLPGHDEGAWNLAFSPDGSMLASNSVGEIRVGALDFDDLLGIAHEELTRSLTDEECRQYLHVDACPTPGSAGGT